MKQLLKTHVQNLTADQLVNVMYVDHVTGVWNRAAYELIKATWRLTMIVDLDSLKWINDNIGHRAGDKALRTVAQLLNEILPDQVFRLSGDEFVVVANDYREFESIVRMPTKMFSYGIGLDLQVADSQLQRNKAEREQQGLRSLRGEKPAYNFAALHE